MYVTARWFIGMLSLLLIVACQANSTAAPTPTTDPTLARGRQVFNAHCATCHALEPDVTIVGPSLAGIATRASERQPDLDAQRYIELSILKPGEYVVEGYPNSMPPDLGKRMTVGEFNDLVAFLLTLNGQTDR